MIVDQLYTQPKPTVTSTRIFTEGRHKKLLKEDATYRKFHNLSRMLAERKMSEKEILDLFAAVEAGANAAGGNRTALGRGKDAVAGAYNSAKDAIGGILNSIQMSTPVAGVDAAYNDATDALGKALGGSNSKIMDSIKKYRLLAKEYPKTQLFVKTALIALAGMATGGAGLVAIAGITTAVDAAIKGEKLSSLIAKGAGASLMALGAQEVQAMLSGGAAPADAPFMGGQQGYDEAGNFLGGTPGYDEAGNYMMSGGGDQIGLPGAETGGVGVPDVTAPELATYNVQPGDTLSKIAQANNTSVQELMGLNPQLAAASGATGGQSLNPDVIFPGQQITLPPGTPGADVYAGGVGTAANTAAKVASGQYPRNPFRLSETVKYKILPVSQLIDHNLTVMGWALNESIGKKPSNSVHLTRNGVFTVIENVDRYRRALLKEYDPSSVGPGRKALPDLYRPDQPGGPAPVTAKPGMIGRGLNWLDKTAGKVGGYLSKQAQNFTRKVTAAKLKMEWQQQQQPSDSDQIAAFLAQQGVPQPVITDVYGKMGIPYTASATVPDGTPAPQQQQGGSGVQTGATSLIDPETGKPYEKRKLAALHNQPAPAPAPVANKTTPAPVANKTTPAPATGKFPGEEPTGPNYVGRLEVKRRQAARAAAASTIPAKPNFAQGGYGSVNYAPNIKTGISLPKTTAPGATPTGTVYKKKVDSPNIKDEVPYVQGRAGSGANPGQFAKFDPATSASARLTKGMDDMVRGSVKAAEKDAAIKAAAAPGNQQLSRDEYIKRIGAPATAETIKQVKKMLETVQTRDDVTFIKKYINHEFDRQGMVNQLATAQRNHLIERVTQIAAQRRRDHAKQLAN